MVFYILSLLFVPLHFCITQEPPLGGLDETESALISEFCFNGDVDLLEDRSVTVGFFDNIDVDRNDLFWDHELFEASDAAAASSEDRCGTQQREPTKSDHAALDVMREEIYSKLLLQFRKASTYFKDFTRISWHRVDVVGWPNEVTFYAPRHWKDSDIRLLAQTVDNISFRCKAGDNAGRYTVTEKQSLLSELKLYSEKLFNSTRISWVKIKNLVTDLHLALGDVLAMDAHDLDTIKNVVIPALKNEWSRTQQELQSQEVSTKKKRLLEQLEGTGDGCVFGQFHSADYILREFFPANLKQFREYVHSRLVLKYRALDFRSTQATRINWAQVIVTGWPKKVIFFMSNRWSINACNSILAALDDIRFEREPSSGRTIPMAYKRELHDKLIRLARQRFPDPRRFWIDLKRQVHRGLHLSRQYHDFWNWKDVAVIEEVVARLERNYQEPNGPESDSEDGFENWAESDEYVNALCAEQDSRGSAFVTANVNADADAKFPSSSLSATKRRKTNESIAIAR